ncbi:MAG: cytochrome P450 [Candidatus Binatia bacterium]|nr:cytochrome P450 [Candidatus Binatia bacterium]
MQPVEALTLEEIDLSAPEFWVRPWAEREGAFQMLRRERPMSFHKELDYSELSVGIVPPGAGYWAVSRHADILKASRNPEIFCSREGATSIPNLPPPFLEFFGGMINMDDPGHQRLRKLVSSGFTPKQLARVSHDVEHAAAEIIGAVSEKGECDFVTDLSAPFPIRIVCDMLGIPKSQHAFVFEKTNIILGAGDPEYVADPTQIIPALLGAGADLVALMKDMRKLRLENPTDDITSALVHADVDGDKMSDEDMGSFFILLVVAGNETTRNSISHGMKALCDYPEQRALFQGDFDRVAPTAVEEIVRWASPVIFMRRTTTQDCELGGQKLEKGEKVILFYNSGNRDELVFDNPYGFDVLRTPNEHVGYGGPGPHFCLGANLARREITVFFRELFQRLPDLQINGEPDRLASNFIHGIKHLSCEFTPKAA